MEDRSDNERHISERRVPENREDLALLNFLKPLGMRASASKSADHIQATWPVDDNKFLIFRLQEAERLDHELRVRTRELVAAKEEVARLRKCLK